MAERMSNKEFVKHLQGWLAQLKMGVVPNIPWQRVVVDRAWVDIVHPGSARHKDFDLAVFFLEPEIELKAVASSRHAKFNRVVLRFVHKSHLLRHADTELSRDVEVAFYPLKSQRAPDKPGTDFLVSFPEAGDFAVRVSFE
ncbi:hypothetical protein D6789_01485 [Candidatus Woesearchaeota archaeon]|nr:MAG: hypothetical protein D6789_01485 [Candidatus Woesearchaeota archaeon]